MFAQGGGILQFVIFQGGGTWMWYIKKIGCGQSFEGMYIAEKSSN